MSKEDKAIHTNPLLPKDNTLELLPKRPRIFKYQSALDLLLESKAVSASKLHFLETLYLSNATSKPKSMYYTDKRWRLVEKSVANVPVEKVVKFLCTSAFKDGCEVNSD
eukprot:TRINITY_DN15604_c0_g1_i1.p1 TRINITY_DN15604_c0_g1~~TRINITY_DN15604_c0_g1_i1.p1  ORF type:complete len:109 (+),score=7.42 TRINITY_DN15604_c0_g1_i1:128-454(+)